ncbi:hypothetical protein AMK59_7458 [Oryctes borbonicus]|uniref:BED-type domain-containing protein n=1 Tax=Oryctes borbonicus TaxID=1629725 RepID=A0A0T6AT01_9SCAR|nr:hypothetical protein AMK59_7458 [Oryctes borbonicus]
MSEDKAECSICRSVYSYKGGTTSNLRKHLKTKHPTISFERSEPSMSTSVEIPPLSSSVIEDDRSSISSRCETQIVPIVSTSFGSEAGSVSRKRKEDADLLSLAREQKISNAILRMIATDLQPFSIVQDSGFRELLRLLEPSYEIPSRTTFSNSLLTREYSKAIEKLRALLNATENVCLTIDAWTSVTNESYVGVTAHFITQNWIFYSCLLDCFYCEKDHAAFHLCSDLRRIASEWGLSDKVYAITTVNAANMVESVKLTGWTHIPCFAHTVNVIVQNGLKEVEIICSKVKNIVQYFNRSTQATNSLILIQEQMNQNIVQLKLKNDVPTRWNSTYSMLERVFKLQQPITTTINSLHIPVELLSEHEWIAIKEICKILEPFEQITNEMSSETAVTLSKVILIVRGLETFLKKLKLVTTTAPARTLIDSLLQSITNGFPYLETNSVFAKCDFLDPRFKKRAFATDEAFEKVKDEIHQEVTSLTNKNTSISQTTEFRPEASEPARENSIDIIDLVWQDFDVSTKTTTSINVIEKTTLEIRSYIEDVPLERKQNPLEWWKTRELLYPNLSKLAKKYLSAVATSVPSERLFSKAGLAISDRRSRLKGKDTQKILFLHYNQHLLG